MHQGSPVLVPTSRVSRSVKSRQMNPLEVSPEQFKSLCEQFIAIASDYLEKIDSRSIPPEANGAEVERILYAPLPETGLGDEAIRAVSDVVQHSRAQNGRFFGYVLGSGEVVGAATDLLCSVLNQNVTAWRSSPAAVTVEKLVVSWLARIVSCREFRGVLCGGGSAANLMGMAMAREAKIPANKSGIPLDERFAIYASTEVHMSIPKAIALLGLGRDNLRLVPVDNSFRMIPSQLERTILRDTESGIFPIAVVGSAGTVNTGAIDPLIEIAAIAAKFGAWFHIDGAYGALGAIAAPHKFLGIDRADSVSLDPHKWLYQSIDCGCLLYRDAGAAQRAFSYSGDYVRALNDDPFESLTFFDESIELSRRFRALKLWFSLRYHGLAAFRKSIEDDLQRAQRLGSSIEGTADLQLMAPIELSAVCFRYVGGAHSEEDLNHINYKILRRIVERGNVYLSNATLQSRFCLRACIVNHRTTNSDIDRVVAEILAVAREVDNAN
jgi:aromatic-L-amino-acid decarboxylase